MITNKTLKSITMSNVTQVFRFDQHTRLTSFPMHVFVSERNEEQLLRIAKEVVTFNGHSYVLVDVRPAHQVPNPDYRFPEKGLAVRFERTLVPATKKLKIKYFLTTQEQSEMEEIRLPEDCFVNDEDFFALSTNFQNK